MANEITVSEQNPATGLMSIISGLAANPNVDIDKLQQLLLMQERWEFNRDKRALRDAMAEFKKNPPAIVKDRTAKVQMKTGGTFEYSFADLDSITRESQVALAQYGVTHGYTTDDSGPTIIVTCILKYGVYEEPGATLRSAPDMSGAKNDIQAKASAVSYLEKYTFMAAAGLAAGMPDNDGAGAQSPAVQALVDDISKAGDMQDLQNLFTAAYKTAQKAKDRRAMAAYTEAKDKRKAELTPKDGE